MTKATGYLSLGFLALVCVTIVSVFIASNYPADPKVLDIELPLRIRDKEVSPDNFITYETTYTQYRRMESTVVTFLVPVTDPKMRTQLTRTVAELPEVHNQHVRNNVFIPPGTLPGEYNLLIEVEYEYNRFRTIRRELGSDNFFVLTAEGERPPATAPTTPDELLPGQRSTAAPVEVQVSGQVEVVATGRPTPTSRSDGTPPAENEPSPEPQPTPSPEPSATPQPTPTPRPLFDPACQLLPVLC